MKKFLSLYLRTVKIAWRKKWHYIAGVTFGILLVAFSNYAVFKIKDIVNATTVVIAHRLSTIKNADRIFVVDGGNIVESGNHKELVQNGNLYAKLWRMQSEGFIKTDN